MKLSELQNRQFTGQYVVFTEDDDQHEYERRGTFSSAQSLKRAIREFCRDFEIPVSVIHVDPQQPGPKRDIFFTYDIMIQMMPELSPALLGYASVDNVVGLSDEYLAELLLKAIKNSSEDYVDRLVKAYKRTGRINAPEIQRVVKALGKSRLTRR